MKTLAYIFLAILFCFRGFAQDTEKDLRANIADDVMPYPDEDVSYETLYENYLQRLSEPLDINRATADELRSLGILNEPQVADILNHREKHGPFLSIYELQAVQTLDPPTLLLLATMVEVPDASRKLDRSFVKRVIRGGDAYMVLRYEQSLERTAGFTHEDSASRFVGGPGRTYYRFRSRRSNDFSYGLTLEKDPGERLRWIPAKSQFGFDYHSAHFQVMNKGMLRNLIIGDFQFQFGQGLVLGNGFGPGKGGETITTLRKANIGFVPYTSVNEAGQMRGVALTADLTRDIGISAFYSSSHRDATMADSAGFSALTVTGFHRNEKELAKRKNLGERCLGSVLRFSRGTFDAGIIAQRVVFETEMLAKEQIYNRFAFAGSDNTNLSAFANFAISNVSVFSEYARTVGQGGALVAGALVSVARNFDLSLLYRNYARDYQPFYGNAFAESTLSRNEKGIYWGVKYKAGRRYTLLGYADMFTFPWLQFRNYAPAVGYEYLLRVEYQPSRKTRIFAQFREENKQRNMASDLPGYVTARVLKRNITVNADYEVSAGLKMKTRIQLSRVVNGGSASRGMVLLQDVTIPLKRFRISVRQAIFETDDFDNRQYVYERDLWLAYSFPAYNGWGVRHYAVVEYKANKHLSVSGRYGRTSYREQDEIGSGTEMIPGNTRNDVKLQAVYRF